MCWTEAWRSQRNYLLKEDLEWDPALGPATQTDREIVFKAMDKVKNGKAAEPTGTVTDKLKDFGDVYDNKTDVVS